MPVLPRYRKSWDYIANFDIDEIIVPFHNYSMPDLLTYLEHGYKELGFNLKSFMMEQAIFPSWDRKRNKW